MGDTKELVFIGTLKNGKKVYDKADSHWQSAHKIVTPELLQEAFDKIETEDDLFVEAIDLGRVVGKTYCVETTDLDQVFKARRYQRVGETPTVINKMPADCSKVAVILNKNDENSYVLATTYIGEIAPMEPWDPTLLESGDEAKIKEAEEFWSKHALIYDRTAIDYFVLEDGSTMQKSEFESKYIHNVNKHKFDAPKDSLLLLMGITGSGTTARAKGFVEQLKSAGIEADIFSSEEIKKELFQNESNNSEIDNSNIKKQVYAEIIERAGENLKQGKFTIVDDTFLFENGENARRELCRIAQENNRPTRAIIIKVSAEQAKAKNKENENPIEEKIIEQMYNYADERYDLVRQELVAMPNTKVEVIGETRTKYPEAPEEPGA